MTHIRATTTQPGVVKRLADVGAITDNTGGTPSRTIPAAGALYSQSGTNDFRASSADWLNTLRNDARAKGLMA